MTRVMMKKIMFYVVFLTAMLFQQSCSKDVEGVVSGFNDDDNREIHFVQNSIIKSFDQGTLVNSRSPLVDLETRAHTRCG